MAVPFNKWEERDGAENDLWEELAKAHGETERRLLQETLQSCYESREFFIVATRPDLSRQPPSSTTATRTPGRLNEPTGHRGRWAFCV